MTNETPYREGRPARLWVRWLARTRTPWLLGALTIAVVLVVRSVVEPGPQATQAMQADALIDATDPPPRSHTGTSVARVGTRRRNRGIERDFFVQERPIITGDPAENPESVPSPSTPPGPSIDEEIEAALNGLVLHAIVMAEQPKAFLNDRFVVVGGKFDIEGVRDIVCEVKAISHESVFFGMGLGGSFLFWMVKRQVERIDRLEKTVQGHGEKLAVLTAEE